MRLVIGSAETQSEKVLNNLLTEGKRAINLPRLRLTTTGPCGSITHISNRARIDFDTFPHVIALVVYLVHHRMLVKQHLQHYIFTPAQSHQSGPIEKLLQMFGADALSLQFSLWDPAAKLTTLYSCVLLWEMLMFTHCFGTKRPTGDLFRIQSCQLNNFLNKNKMDNSLGFFLPISKFTLITTKAKAGKNADL